MQGEHLLTRAAVRPESADPETRTVEVVWSTGAPVQRRDAAGVFLETLSLDPAHVDLSRLDGAAVLDAHRRAEVRHVLGVVEQPAVDGERGTATLRFSARPDVEPIWQDVLAGVIRHLSVGYSVETWRTETDPQTSQRVRRAVAWTPHEVSIVPLPADAGATIRSYSTMENDEAQAANTEGTGAAPATQDTRAQVNEEIRSIASVANLAQAWVVQQIDANATPEGARASAFDQMRQRSGPPVRPATVTSPDGQSPERRTLASALHLRMQPDATDANNPPSEATRALAGRSLFELAERSLQGTGVRTSMLGRDEILERALMAGGTSDFQTALVESSRRVLMEAYTAAPAPLRTLARRVSASDFRSRQALRMSGIGRLDEVHEHGELRHATRQEEVEAYRVRTFGKIFSLTREAIYNDDLQALSDWAQAAGRASAETEAQELLALLSANAGAGVTMRDGSPVFHSDHGNLAATGGTIDVSALDAARKAMRDQRDQDGTPIDAAPAAIMVPNALETTAEQFLASIQAPDPASVNPFTGRLRMMVEPRLTDPNAWYVFADPARVPTFEMASLNGANGPQLASKEGWETLGMQFRATLDFGCTVLDWRGCYRNAGA